MIHAVIITLVEFVHVPKIKGQCLLEINDLRLSLVVVDSSPSETRQG